MSIEDLLSKCIFIPRNNKHFSMGIDVKLINLFAIIGTSGHDFKIKDLVGNFRGIVIYNDVLGDIEKMEDLNLTFKEFKVIHINLGIDISDLRYREVVSFIRSQKIDKILS